MLSFADFVAFLHYHAQPGVAMGGVISGNDENATKNRIGPGSQHSGRVGRRSYARFKAQIALENIQTFFGRV